MVTRYRIGKKVVCEEKEDISCPLLYPSLGCWNNDSSILNVIHSFIASKYSRRKISIESV